MPAFEELGLCDELLGAVYGDELGWQIPTAVQDEAIPLILGSGDVMVAAETGSGKTGAFALPILQLVFERKQRFAVAERPSKRTKVERRVEWNRHDRNPSLSLSSDGMQAQSRDHFAWNGVRATAGCSRGACYYEGEVVDEGLCRIGWATEKADLNLGTSPGGYGFGGTGMKSHSRKFEKYGEAFGKGDIVGCLLDWNKKQISFSKNGKEFGVAYTIDDSATKGGPLYPAVVLKNAEMAFNFGATPFKHCPEHAQGLLLPDGSSSPTITFSSRGPPQKGGVSGVQALVMAPTRDLASQIFDVFRTLSRCMESPMVSAALLVGGVDSKREAKALQRGDIDIVVGTPGKMREFIKKKQLPVANVSTFVLDEADQLLDGGNLPTVLEIFGMLPSGEAGTDRLQVCFFSATLHSVEIRRLAEQICHHPTWVDLKGKDALPDAVSHFVCTVGPSHPKYLDAWNDDACKASTDLVHRHDAVGDGSAEGSSAVPGKSAEASSEGIKRMKLYALKNIIDELKPEQCIVFCRTNLDCDNAEKFLVAVGGGRRFAGSSVSGKENRYSCCVVAGWRSTHERRANLEAFKAGDVRILVCTDVAARGIDVKELPCVINVTLPDNAETYIHRVGRVGRVGCPGVAVSIVSQEECKEKVWFCQKGKRPPCADTRLYEMGGNCVWYDESALFASVEERLQIDPGTVPQLDGFALPGGVRLGDDIAVARNAEQALIEEARDRRLDQIKPTVASLRSLESQVQSHWLLLRTRQFCCDDEE